MTQAAPRLGAVDEAQHAGGGDPPHIDRGGMDRGQRGQRGGRKELVIEANHGHIAWDAGAVVEEAEHHAIRRLIGGGEDGGDACSTRQKFFHACQASLLGKLPVDEQLYPNQHNQIVMTDGTGTYTCANLCDIIHSERARVLATYGDDFYAGTPVVTQDSFGKGHAYYIATDADDRFLDDFYGRLLQAHNIAPLLETPEGVEVTPRETAQRRFLFVLNHNAGMMQVALPEGRQFWKHVGERLTTNIRKLPGYGVTILEART